MTKYNKLVRDKIPEIIEADGSTSRIRVIEKDIEYLNALLDKLHEETDELRQTPSLEERADVQEVLRAIDNVLGFKPEDVEKIRAEKEKKRGGFDKRIFLISTD